MGWEMYFPRFLVGMVATVCTVATWVYTATGSMWVACCWAIVAVLLLQAVYFWLVLYLVYGNRSGSQVDGSDSREPVSEFSR